MEETAGYEERFSLGLEDVASYRDFFSAEEWDELESNGWVLKKGGDDPWGSSSVGRGVDLDRSRSGVRSRSKEGKLRSTFIENAATSDDKVMEDENPNPDPSSRPERSHRVAVAFPPGTYEGNEERYELECDVCDYVGAADTIEEAQAIARLHEAFVAKLMGRVGSHRMIGEISDMISTVEAAGALRKARREAGLTQRELVGIRPRSFSLRCAATSPGGLASPERSKVERRAP